MVPAKRTMQPTESVEFQICERLENEKQFSAMVPMRVLGAPTAWGPQCKSKERDSVGIAATAIGLLVKL